MYECEYLSVKDMMAFLGLGRCRILRLCQEKTHGFPAVKVGNKYQADLIKLRAWKDDWFAGKFDIND